MLQMQRIGVTIRDLFQLDCMRHTKIVAGHNGLNRIVSNVNVMEVPDIGNWVAQGDLLITTAYSIRNDVNAQANLIPELAKKGLAGLCLKPKRYLDAIPAQMIEQANALNFPLLELPIETSFSNVINGILAEILQFQTMYFRKSEEAHRLLMEVMLKGGHIEDLIITLAKLIENSVVIYDANGSILAKCLINWSETDFKAAAEQVNKIDSTLVDPLDSGVKYEKARISSDPPLNEYRTPIIGRGRTCGYLAIWDNNGPLIQNDFIFCDRAMSMSAIEILNEKSVIEIERRYRNEFLDDLLRDHPNGINVSAFIERGRCLGWDLTLNYDALVFHIDDSKENTASIHLNELTIQSTKETLFDHLMNSLRPKEKFILGSKCDSIILLLAPPEDAEDIDLKEFYSRRAEELLRHCQERIKNFPISVGIGRYYPGIDGLRKSYSEALKALSIGKNFLGQNKVIHFDNLGIYRLLQQITDFDELKSFYRETIFPLDQHDQSNNSELVTTLIAYFDCNNNLKQVSKKLFTHYNTILYRMERISKITGLDLDSPEHRLNLQIGLKIRLILKENRSTNQTGELLFTKKIN